MPNLVSIDIRAQDLTGPGFAGVLARVAALKAALADASGVSLNFSNVDGELARLKAKLQAHGIADLIDYNLNQGQIDTQLLLLKRRISDAKISDLLDVNLNASAAETALSKLEADVATTEIPLRVTLAKDFTLPTLGATESVNIGGGVSSATLGNIETLRAELAKTADEYGVLLAEMDEMRTPRILSALPDLEDFDRQLVKLGADLGALDQPGSLTSAALAELQGRVTAAGRALDEFESSMPQAVADMEALHTAGAAAGSVFASGADMYANATAEMEKLGAAAAGTATGTDKTSFATKAFTNAIANGMPMWTAAGKNANALAGHVQLFGGALTQIGVPALLATQSGFELVLHGALEVIGTLGPASIAFIGFAAAAVPAVMDIYQQMRNLNTINKAFGTNLYPLTGGFQKLAQAIEPNVMQLFGDALVIAGQKTGVFATMVKQTGTVLDQLGARFVYAVTAGNGFGGFLRNGAKDLAGWGTLVGNLGGILGAVFKVLPGYAGIMLNLADGITHVAEAATIAAEPLLKIGLAAHGAIVYIGLAATAGSLLLTKTLQGVATLALASATKLDGLGTAGAAASKGLLGVGSAAEEAATMPWGWILGAAAGLVILIVELSKSKDAMTQFNQSVQSAVQNAKLADLGATIATGLSQTYVQLSQAQHRVAQTGREMVSAAHQSRGAYEALVGTQLQNVNAVGEAQQGYSQLQQQQRLVTTRVAALAKQYGGTTAAMALMNQAGITSSQVTDQNNQNWAKALIQIKAQDDALRAMNITMGRAAAAGSAMGSDFMTSMLPAVQKVTQAEDMLFNTVIGGEQSFTAFQQGVQQAGTDAQVTGAHLGGLNAASLTLANDYWTTLLPAGQKLIDSLQSQGVSTGELTKAVADEAKQMLTFAGNNTAAKAAVVALINNALGPGTVNLKSLNKWVGQNSTSMKGFKAIVDKATISAGTLAKVLQSDLNAQFAQDLLVSSGAAKALRAYTTDITHNQTATAKGRGDRAQLIKDLENAGYSAKQARQMVANLSTSVGNLKGKNINITAHASGSGGITFAQQILGQNKSGYLEFHAQGGLVGGSGGPTSDSNLIAASRGEYVMKAAAVDKYGLHMMNALNSGLVDSPAVPGNWAASRSGSFLQASELEYMRSAIAAAKAAASSSWGQAGPGGGSPSANAALARRMFPAYGSGAEWYAWNYVANRESGWNQFATNPASGAYGIGQALPFTKMPKAAWPAAAGGSSNPAAQISWMLGYMNSRYGGPIGAMLHEQAYNWYGDGVNGVVSRPTLIGVGERGPERVSVTPLGAVGAAQKVVLEVSAAGQTAFERFMVEAIRNWVRVKAGGDVQKAFGRN